MNISRSRRDQETRSTRYLAALLAAAFLAVLLAGCVKETPEKAAPPARPKAPAAAKPQADSPSALDMKALVESREETYEPQSAYDPFMPIPEALDAGANPTNEESAEQLTPLQKMDLAQVRLVAIIIDDKNSRALVEDSTGMGYIIQVGTPMGTRGGKVASIMPDKIKVEEYSKNYLGEKTVEETYLEIPKDPNEASLKPDSIEGEVK
ncbi:MAG: pilus assembly protein PilP [Pseudomonadota bacterium]